jgi:ribosomal protein S6--L-glutamate ligase
VAVLGPDTLSARLCRGRSDVVAGGLDLERFEVFLTPRVVGDSGDEDFQLQTYRLLVEQGALLVNDVGALLDAVDKFRSSVLFERAGVPTPPVAVVQQSDEAEAVLERWGVAVSKPLCGSLGEGVRLLRAGEVGRDELAALCGAYGALYLQRFVGGSDVRAFVVGDRVLGAIRRRPQPGVFAANVHQGADVEPAALDPLVEAAAVRAAQALGLEYTGVDLIETPSGPQIIEVNGTPRWEGIQRATGSDVASAIVDHAVALARSGLARARGAQRESNHAGRELRQPGAMGNG